ncbi:MAG: hypothetical protein AAF587_30745 [Bacteroidota bacterium]
MTHYNKDTYPNIFILDNKEKAAVEFANFRENYLLMVVYNYPAFSTNHARAFNRAANTVATNQEGLPEKRVLLIEDAAVLEAVKTDIETLLKTKGATYGEVAAFTTIKGTETVAATLSKNEMVLPTKINGAFNTAISAYAKLHTNNNSSTA